MERLECPQCKSPLRDGAAVCGECGRELEQVDRKPEGDSGPRQEEERGNKGVYAVLAVFLAVVGGAALLFLTGVLPNPIQTGSTAAIVDGEKISVQEVDQKLDLYKKMAGQNGNMDLSGPDGKNVLAETRMQILQSLIQERILVAEALRQGLTVSPDEIAAKIRATREMLNLSDRDFENFLKNHGMNLDGFEKRMERDLLINKLIAKVSDEKGEGAPLQDWFKELSARAKVEVLAH